MRRWPLSSCQGLLAAFLGLLMVGLARADTPSRVVDVPTREGVTERLLVLAPPEPKAVVVLLAGGHGGLQIQPDGSMRWGRGNFLVRSRELFAQQGLVTIVLDAPSDRQSPPFLENFRQTDAHVADLKAVIAWVHAQWHLPAWLVGTSRGTQSAAYVATQLSGPDGPEGIVLTSTILTDKRSRAVPQMSLADVRIPVLAVQHEQDGCKLCSFSLTPMLMERLSHSPRKQLIGITGGQDEGDPCEAFAHHGFNGQEAEVVAKIASWVLAR